MLLIDSDYQLHELNCLESFSFRYYPRLNYIIYSNNFSHFLILNLIICDFRSLASSLNSLQINILHCY